MGVQFILLSIVIGSRVFTMNGQVLRLAGPLGLVLAVILQGLFVVAVAETIAEMAYLFPVPNAISSHVKAFVDEDWAWIVGVCYW